MKILHGDCLATDLACGIAAEHLVCAELLLAGYTAFLSGQHCPYDIAVEHQGRLIRLQVKATRKQRAIPQRKNHIPAYMWHVRRAGKGNKRNYNENDFDLLALVALDIRSVAYLPQQQHLKTIHIRPPGSRGGKQFSDFPFNKALEVIQ